MTGRLFELPFELNDMQDGENGTFDGNGTLGNVTGTAALALTDGEMVAAVVIGLIGFAGIVMNLGVLVVVYKGNLVKADHRMLYYIFMTCGDLMFAIHSFLNVFSILFKEFYVFQMFAVCLNIQIVLGITSYQWSAVCIILLIVDLTWSVVYPFTENKNKKLFSKLGCIGTFIMSVAIAIGPFLYWNDSPKELAFCSIGNVYGVHWDFYQKEAVAVLTILLLTMVLSCGSLLLAVYRTNKPVTKSERTSSPSSGDGESKAVIYQPEQTDSKERVVTVSGSIDEPKQEVPAEQSRSSLTVDENGSGLDNLAFKSDENVAAMNGGRTASKQFQDSELANALKEAQTRKSQGAAPTSGSQADARHKRFLVACRTVMFFVATYIGCCLPYYILMVMRIGCSEDCIEDTPETRRTRTIVAATLYLLPIVDPILYIKRFKVFNQTMTAMLKKMRHCCFRP